MNFKFQPSTRALFKLVLFLVFMALPLGLSAQNAAPQAAATSSEAHAQSDGDVLQVNDMVRVAVFREDDMLTEARVSKSGYITLPLLGQVQVAGKTVGEAVSDIRARLDKDYIINPQVSITILQYAGQWVTVLGEVQKPGQVQIPPEGDLDLLGAIALAGGYTRVADASRVIIRRTVNGHDVVMKVDARKLARNVQVQPFIVEPGDRINVGESIW
jgi:protein involved in polysaccharide export with SLBB domain